MRTLDDFLNAQVYNGVISDEVSKPSNYHCFNGAWYYKALSSKDMWLGMEAVVTLPKFTPDEERFDFIKESIDKDEQIKRYKDTPSIYLGGSSDFESDIGLGWFRGIVDNEFTKTKIAYRPFYRYIYEEDGKILNQYAGTAIRETEYYYFPGDKLKLSVYCIQDNYLRLKIELLEASKYPEYIDLRKKLNPTKTFTSPDFPAFGNGVKPAEYKRVNAIDQYGNEGKPTQMTNAIVGECIWHEVYLFRKVEGNIVKVPFNHTRYIQMLCPTPSAFEVCDDGLKQTVVIKPQK